MNLARGSYKYVVVGFNGDPSSTGFASRVSAVTAEMTKGGSRALVVRFVPMPHRNRSWKKRWQRSDQVDLLEIPALPISRYAWLRRLSVAVSAFVLQAIVAWVRPKVVQCECHEAASLGSQLEFEGLLYADLHGAAPEEARYTRLTAGRSDMSMVEWLNEVEDQIVRRFDKLIVVAPRMIEHLEVKTGVSLHAKASVLPIFADESFFKPLHKEYFKRELGLDGKIVFLYSGGMQRYQCIEETIVWFQALSARIPNAFFLMFTPEPKVAGQRAEAIMGELPGNIRIASVDQANLADHMSAADFGFVLREPELLNAVASPTKAVEYLARGVRLICTKDAGSAFDHMNRFGSGLILPLVPTAKDVDLALTEINRLLAVDVPVEAVHRQLSRGGYAKVLRQLYGHTA
ncbi:MULTISPECIES: hypothetical protein [unclassified Aliiroseovarius]|uniref:hypothetical protein n=1 Tax=unclassified Aliiroseovarius TaxID=2623558 RepID=UPI001567CA18|nr:MULTISPECIES: hypothetical protein [unclassified Aliiroseovarius]NRP30880.1 hypothetical protein [Aliiroseovarius sp. xm-m-314]NRP80522.1 hypothetical protein [Aliiroseovarius sp. xm-v-209]